MERLLKKFLKLVGAYVGLGGARLELAEILDDRVQELPHSFVLPAKGHSAEDCANWASEPRDGARHNGRDVEWSVARDSTGHQVVAGAVGVFGHYWLSFGRALHNDSVHQLQSAPTEPDQAHSWVAYSPLR